MIKIEPQFGGTACPETVQRTKCRLRKCLRGPGMEKRRWKEAREKRRSEQAKKNIDSEQYPGKCQTIIQYARVCLSFLHNRILWAAPLRAARTLLAFQSRESFSNKVKHRHFRSSPIIKNTRPMFRAPWRKAPSVNFPSLRIF